MLLPGATPTVHVNVDNRPLVWVWSKGNRRLFTNNYSAGLTSSQRFGTTITLLTFALCLFYYSYFIGECLIFDCEIPCVPTIISPQR